MDFFSKTEFKLDLVLRMSEKLGAEIPTLKLCIHNKFRKISRFAFIFLLEYHFAEWPSMYQENQFPC